MSGRAARPALRLARPCANYRDNRNACQLEERQNATQERHLQNATQERQILNRYGMHERTACARVCHSDCDTVAVMVSENSCRIHFKLLRCL